MKLTAKSVENIRPTADRREVPDAHMRGLYLVVQPSGVKSWAVRYRHGGKSHKYTVGPFPAFNLQQARDAAAKALRVVAEGRDPARERQEARADTVESIAKMFLERYSKRHNRPRTVEANETMLRLHVLPRWGQRVIHSIGRRDVIDLIEEIARERPVAGNRVLSLVSKMFAWSVETSILQVSPCQGVKAPAPERSRERVLDDNELRRVWNAAGTLPGAFGAITKLLILTAARRDEVIMMRWSEIDMDKRLWTLPGERTKNGRVHALPLSSGAMDVLASIPRDGDLVFAENGKPAHGNGKRQLDAAVGSIAPWRLHDLRRTCATGLAQAGVSLQVVEKILNHASGSLRGVAGIYNRHSYADEMRTALELWSQHVVIVSKAGKE